MQHPDPDDLALLALGESLGSAVDAHVADCQACSAEIETLRTTVGLAELSNFGEDAPPPGEHVWQAIAAELGFAETGRSSVATLDHPRIRICLDPANTVANLELPADVTARCAPYVANWHVKDFDFSRNPGWVGFVYTGTALGDGRLDYDGMLALLRPAERGITQIIEFWLPWQDTVPAAEQALATTRLEAEWTRTTLDQLRRRNS